MGHQFKSKTNPTTALRKKVIELSKSKNWDDAIKEWEFLHYYEADNCYVTCPGCGPRAIKHIAILINKFNSNQLLVSNSCAELHFDINTGNKIANALARVKKNATCQISPEVLEYLLKHNTITWIQYENYKIAGKQTKDSFCIYMRTQVNQILKNFCKYKFKEALAQCELIFPRLDTEPLIEPNTIVNIRRDILEDGVLSLTNKKILDTIITEYELHYFSFTPKEKKEGISKHYKFPSINCIEEDRRSKASKRNLWKTNIDLGSPNENFMKDEMYYRDLAAGLESAEPMAEYDETIIEPYDKYKEQFNHDDYEVVRHASLKISQCLDEAFSVKENWEKTKKCLEDWAISIEEGQRELDYARDLKRIKYLDISERLSRDSAHQDIFEIIRLLYFTYSRSETETKDVIYEINEILKNGHYRIRFKDDFFFTGTPFDLLISKKWYKKLQCKKYQHYWK